MSKKLVKYELESEEIELGDVFQVWRKLGSESTFSMTAILQRKDAVTFAEQLQIELNELIENEKNSTQLLMNSLFGALSEGDHNEAQYILVPISGTVVIQTPVYEENENENS